MAQLFLAIDLADELKDRLALLPERLHLRGARVVPAHQLHLTIRFLGAIADQHLGPLVTATNAAAAAQRPFSVELAGGGSFGPPQHPQVVWVGVRDPSRLQALADDVDAALATLPCAPRDHPFAAHVTLARARGHLRGQLDELRALEPQGSMEVRRLTLFRSRPGAEGSVYQAIAAAPLQGAS